MRTGTSAGPHVSARLSSVGQTSAKEHKSVTSTKSSTIALVAGTVALAIITSACSSSKTAKSTSNGGGKKKLTIGSILYGVDGYQVAHGKAMEAYGRSIGVKVRTCNSNNSLAGQQKCVQDLTAARVDGIVLQPFEPVAGAAEVKQIQAAGIPVITWAIGPVPGVQAPFVDLAEKEQAKQAGETAAKWVKEHFRATPKIVDLGVPNNTNCSNREDGFIEGVKSVDPAAQVVARPNGMGVRLASQNAMADIIQSGKQFNIVTGCNGESTLGALAALRAAGKGKAVNKAPVSEYLFSVDGTQAEVKELINPTSPLMSTLALTPKDNTKALLDDLLKLINKKITNSDDSVHLKDVFLPTDCGGVNKILKDQYGTTVACA